MIAISANPSAKFNVPSPHIDPGPAVSVAMSSIFLVMLTLSTSTSVGLTVADKVLLGSIDASELMRRISPADPP